MTSGDRPPASPSTALVLRALGRARRCARALPCALAVLIAVISPGCSRPATGSHVEPLVYVGSSTIGDHVIPEASREFARRRGVGVREGPTGGSGLGIETLLAGEADVAGVARSLTVDEKQLPIEYTIIGYDAIRVFVHPSNPVSSLDEMQLRGIFTGKISRWNEIGGNDAPIVCITQVWGAQRAQMVEFQKQLLRGAGFRTDRREFDRQSDEIRALSDEPNGITVVSAAYATADVRAIMLQGTVQDRHGLKLGGYALSRPLLLLTPAEASTESKDFVRFLLSPAGQAIVAHKFIPLRPLQPVGSS